MNIKTVLRSSAVWRGLIGLVGAIAILAWPELLAGLIVWLIGIGAIAGGITEAIVWNIDGRKNNSELVRSLVLIVGGLYVLLAPSEPVDLVRIGVAAIIAIRALGGMYQAYKQWRKSREDPFWPVVRGILALALAVSIILIPRTLLALIVVVVAAAWIIGGLVVLINALSRHDDSPAATDLAGVMRERSMEPETREKVTEALFDGMDSWDGSVRFVTLMAFSTTIATFGIKADSSAVVIGAMLIAPLMSPIMALSAGILMGWAEPSLYALRRAWFGVAIAVATSFVMSMISPDLIDITLNTQVLSRTTPTINDLLIALAAGGAGGYALSHPQVSDSLPGVAIAVALVPPLAVIGVSLQAGEIAFAGGAFLLFLANFVGILVAAGVVFLLTGYSPWSRFTETGEAGRRSSGLVAVSLVLVFIPLALIGNDVIAEINDGTVAREAVDDWLAGNSDTAVASVMVDGGNVDVRLVSGGNVPPADELASSLADHLGRDVDLTVTVTPQITHEVSSG